MSKDDSEASKKLLTSDYAVVELGNIWLFDEKNSTVGISYILRPGPSTEYGKFYDYKITWGEYLVGGSSSRFRSQDFVFEGKTIVLEEAAAEQFIKLLTETSEYQRLLRAFENLQEEKRKFHEKEEEIAYNLFWKGEAPSYDEYKKTMTQLKDMDAREKQIIQEFYEFPYTARLPDSFINSLELIVTEQ
ncbi:hypothetical protein ACFLXZ_01050 [Chloroflexota bacterium]